MECPDSTYAADPALVFARAKGETVWDVEGRRYRDFCAGFGVLALGHNPDCFHDVWQDLLSPEPRNATK